MLGTLKAGGDNIRAANAAACANDKPDGLMPNVFLLYVPPGNHEAVVHYEDTIKRRVPVSRIAPFVTPNVRAKLTAIFGHSPIAVWGSQAGKSNRSKFERMAPGDDILIVEGDTIKLIGKIAAKVESEALSKELWQTLSGKKKNNDWRLIYFIANPRELELEFAEFIKLFGYRKKFRLRGFTTVSSDRLETFYTQYDDLYSVLVRIQDGLPVSQRVSEVGAITATENELVELTREQVDEVLRTDVPTDHVRMQWKLARLGLKAGERVWVPVGDQAKLRKTYDFNEFDTEFSAGIDLPHSYIKNIDVVWKQEFRIGAAYEIENSTSIYSGLLRFADLNILAPNTLYPMFVVAPQNRKNKLREQLRRPTFKQLALDEKVLFLSYETIDDIDEFFATTNAGLSVDLIAGRAERVT